MSKIPAINRDQIVEHVKVYTTGELKKVHNGHAYNKGIYIDDPDTYIKIFTSDDIKATKKNMSKYMRTIISSGILSEEAMKLAKLLMGDSRKYIPHIKFATDMSYRNCKIYFDDHGMAQIHCGDGRTLSGYYTLDGFKNAKDKLNFMVNNYETIYIGISYYLQHPSEYRYEYDYPYDDFIPEQEDPSLDDFAFHENFD